MKKILLWMLLAAFFIVAFKTKPDDKTCTIAAVRAVWGNRTPDMNDKPQMFEQFMNLNSKQVIIDDYVFFKRIRYRFSKKEYNIGIGMFNRIITHDS